MIRLSIPTRQALARLMLPVLVMASFGMMLLGKADAVLAERARIALGDLLSPLYAIVAEPLMQVRDAVQDTLGLVEMRAENERLRKENETLRRWQAVAMALDAENALLKAHLHWVPDPAPSYISARVVDDAGGVYARAVLVSLPPGHSLTRAQIVLDGQGLVGRITEVGARSARVMLLTDLNSRIPVTLEGSRGRALLVGSNGPRPRLQYWTEGVLPAEGERVVTSAEVGAFPAGLPVGVVHYSASHVPEVQLFADLGRLEVVRIFDYGLQQLRPSDVRPADAKSADLRAPDARPIDAARKQAAPAPTIAPAQAPAAAHPSAAAQSSAGKPAGQAASATRPGANDRR